MGGGQFLFTNIDGAKTFFKKKFRVGKKSSKKVEEAKKKFKWRAKITPPTINNELLRNKVLIMFE